MESTVNAMTSEIAPALRVRGIRKSYEVPGGRLQVLDGIDFDVPRGTILAILGASGSGKSTLLNILGTLDRAEAGTLELAGHRLDPMGEPELA
ncbi:MAG: ATP-binding cassette domain-containing protein, partial [Gaiellaceae bacterium]